MKTVVAPARCLFMVLFTLSLSGTVLAEPFKTEGWSWRKPIETGTLSPGFVRLMVTPELFDALQPDLRDLRILDSEGQAVPYLIQWQQNVSDTEIRQYPARLFNQTYEPGRFTCAVADFGQPLEKEYIDIHLNGQNYCRRVTIEGSQDPQTWNLITDNLWLIDIQKAEQFRLDRLELPPNNFRFLRITVYNMLDETERFNITGVSAERRVPSPHPTIPVPIQGITIGVEEKSGNTIIEVDAGYKNLPLSTVRFQVNTPLFYRGVQVTGRNTLVHKAKYKTESGWREEEEKTPWQPIKNSIIHRMKESAREQTLNRIELGGAQYRYLKITILNGDNPPLDVTSVEMERSGASLVFSHEAGQQYALIGGNPEAQSPVYDLAKTAPDLNVEALPEVVAGMAEEMKQVHETQPWTERHGWLVGLALCIATAAVALLVLSNLKRLNAGKEKEKSVVPDSEDL